ncbi:MULTISPECIES: nucleoside hydrolase [Brenneria]|uniref:Nucleoside hydrolase n=1 Tax=Brenneria nigrifluens DSM 30175 = ATCC 13028 TaxID=1121120 RepID=A0A2U1ULT0_9GAMM|nr:MULTISPECIES: nucleoside hydrolase [Brenneria]EHD19480.1 Ribosylpyrimidine nucleosidase [Brenneria sp. EniD312]PWC22635.1 nucleoside hydrolase [Brenneria nigrifluens] [Brenneria nigrifluens DSM 30175 = ATCC 13028]QCR02756.1 nucleoside hydrolase [Brenneria nigrifluens] [Brenneria nigrifluens DSM 30175 = ATCC 13028]
MSAVPIIIDCDPGIDDAIALLSAFVAPELDILGICAVCGNQPLERTVRNALQITELGRRTDIPVYAGCHRPLFRQPLHGQFHGESGLGNTVLPSPQKRAEAQHAVSFIIELCEKAAAAGRPLTLCTLGPLTNLATALLMKPSIAAGIERIVMMGGAYREAGNRSLTSEFNMLADPHAAHVVFSSSIAIVALPLDATHQVILTPDHVARFIALAGRISAPLGELMAFWDRNDIRRYGSRGGPLHDPLVIAWVLAPDYFSSEKASVYIEHESELCMGQTVADWYGKTARTPNVDVVTGVDAAGVFGLFSNLLSRY